MYAEAVTISRPDQAASRWLASTATKPHSRLPVLHREQHWRQSGVEVAPFAGPARILASRWTDERTTRRYERSSGSANHYVIGVALRPVRLKLGRGADIVFEGTMSTGMIHVTEPGQNIEVEFFTPCDFVHFHVAADYLRERQAASAGQSRAVGNGASTNQPGLRDLLIRDSLAAQLCQTLTDDLDGGDPLYAESVGQTVLMRVLALRPAESRVGALPKWRLRRVQEHLTANIAEPITLAALADAAGLSRMHFAAQFRAATGCRPHDYLLQHRIEHAKEMMANTDTPLVEVALSVGFQTQSHFSTVFKRLAGDTPARWQRARRAL